MVEVLEIRLRDNGKSSLKGFCDIKINDIILRDFRILKSDGRKPQIVPPQISWKDKDGIIRYRTVVTLPDELEGEVSRLILNTWHQEMEKRNANSNTN